MVLSAKHMLIMSNIDRIVVLEMRQRAKQTIVMSQHVETEPQEAHSGKEETYFDLTCSSTVLTVQSITLFVTETIEPRGCPQFLHHTSEHGFAECRI